MAEFGTGTLPSVPDAMDFLQSEIDRTFGTELPAFDVNRPPEGQIQPGTEPAAPATGTTSTGLPTSVTSIIPGASTLQAACWFTGTGVITIIIALALTLFGARNLAQ